MKRDIEGQINAVKDSVRQAFEQMSDIDIVELGKEALADFKNDREKDQYKNDYIEIQQSLIETEVKLSETRQKLKEANERLANQPHLTVGFLASVREAISENRRIGSEPDNMGFVLIDEDGLIGSLFDLLTDTPPRESIEPTWNAEDCDVCAEVQDLCRYHQGAVDATLFVADKLASIANDPELLNIIPNIRGQ